MLYERTALSRKPEALIRQQLNALRNKGAGRHLPMATSTPEDTSRGWSLSTA